MAVFAVEIAQPWPLSVAMAQGESIQVEGIVELAFLAAVTANPGVSDLAARAPLLDPQRTAAFGSSPMDERAPVHVVSMPFATRAYEADWGELLSPPIIRVAINEAVLLGSIDPDQSPPSKWSGIRCTVLRNKPTRE